MSKWGTGIITDAGRNLIAKSQLGEPLTLTRMAMGDGTLGATDPKKLTALLQEVLTKPFVAKRLLEDGSFQARADVHPEDIPRDFYWREVGLLAKGANGQEVLYAYQYAGEDASFIAAGARDTYVLQFPINVENAQNVTILVDESAAYPQLLDFEQVKAQLAEVLSKMVPNDLTINEKPLTGPIVLSYTDVGAAAQNHKHAGEDITSGIVATKFGGSGLSKSPSMIVDLENGSAADIFTGTPRPGVEGVLSSVHGGLGKSLHKFGNALTYAQVVNQLKRDMQLTMLDNVSGLLDVDLILSSSAYRPTISGQVSCGAASYRWNHGYFSGTLFAGNSTINTSDARFKKEVEGIDEAMALIMGIQPVQFRWQKKGADEKLHYGFIAQQVRDVLKDAGVAEEVVYDRQVVEDIDDADATEDQVEYGIAYTELIAPLVAVVQRQQKQIEGLIAQVERLQNGVSVQGR